MLKIGAIFGCLSILFAALTPVVGQTTRPVQPVSGATADGWAGPSSESVPLPGTFDYRVLDGPRGRFKHGFRVECDSSVDWQAMEGLRFNLDLRGSQDVTLDVTVFALGSAGTDPIMTAVTPVHGEGTHAITLPWSAFDHPSADTAQMKFVKAVRIAAHGKDDHAGATVRISDVRAVAAPAISLECDVRGQAVLAGQVAEYTVHVSNTTDRPQAVALGFARYGWEAMNAHVEPKALTLAAGEGRDVTVHVTVSDRVAPGGHETQTLQAIPNGDADAAQRLAFITLRELPHPYLLHDASRWQEVRDKVARYAWAKQTEDAYVKQAAAWTVPEIAKPPGSDPGDTFGPFLFATQNENALLACGYAWQLTGEKSAAEKVATFLRRLSDPATGYPKTLRGCNQGLVQEGHFFQHIAMAYDMVRDAGVLSDADRANIDATFRLFMTTVARESDRGSINNWNLSELCGAFYCALAMQDLSAADRFFAGPGGIKDQLAKGTMDDGWWYECSISYNMWCASEFTQVALAYRAFGYDFLHERVPASYSPKVLLTTQLSGGTNVVTIDSDMVRKPFGMDADVYGPNRRNNRTITDLWNSLLPFINGKGVMFGVNDSAENVVTGNRTEVSGQPFELAYYAFRDPKYASLIKLGNARDLLYGVPELPEKTPELFRDNAAADNVGLVMLRSQTPDRPPREQIQAVLHYGTHGWAHGHFDRTDLLSLMRYGRSFWNPESIWWSYEPFMYKFFVQTSVNHNMVVVDGKMQAATPGTRLLLHSGKAFQATAVETTARWSHPPYGGMVYDYVPVKTFAEKQWREGRSVPTPTTLPDYGTLTEFTEPILQRRLMIVTDDCVVLADYAKGDKPHTFDSLLQLRGFTGIAGATPTGHVAQYDTDPRSSGQFITDCDIYALKGPSLATFKEVYGPGTDQAGNRTIGNDDGELNLGVHTAWPIDQRITVATAPEPHETQKRLWYTVIGDGRTLADGKFGSWLLGRGDVDVAVDGVKSLELQTRTELAKQPTLFWLNATVVTRDGRLIPLAHVPLKTTNVTPAKGPGVDYFGGPVKVQGNRYADTLAAEPQDAKRPSAITVDLSGIDAVRFKSSVGGDYPLGNEAQRRKTFAVRSQGSDASFLTVIEPYDTTSVIRSVHADGPDAVTIDLVDGRSQQFQITGLHGDGKRIGIALTETKDGQILRQESTADQDYPTGDALPKDAK